MPSEVWFQLMRLTFVFFPLIADLRPDCCFALASLPRLLANVSTDCTAEIICRWLNIVSFYTVDRRNTEYLWNWTKWISLYFLSFVLFRQWDELRGVVAGYAPLLAYSAVCLKGSGHFTGCGFDFPCSVCSDQCAHKVVSTGVCDGISPW